MAADDEKANVAVAGGEEEECVVTADALAELLAELSREGRNLLGAAGEDPLSGIADIAETRAQIEADMRATERELLAATCAATPDFAAAHAQLRAGETALSGVQATLDSYERAMAQIAQQIEALRARSGGITVHLRNRRAAAQRLDAALGALVIPPDLVRAVTEGDVGDGAYCAHLARLSRLLAPPGDLEQSAAYGDVCGVAALLGSLAAMRVRDFLYAQLYALTKPGTNVQIIQQSVLDRHAPLNHFLIAHAPHYAAEIRDSYVATMGEILHGYFLVYLSRLPGLILPIGSREDTLGTVVSAAAAARKGRPSVFSLKINVAAATPSPAQSPTPSSPVRIPGGDRNTMSRLRVLEELDNPSIIPHVAEQYHQLFPYEDIYRSNLHLLVDTISAEYIFDVRWFKRPAKEGSGPKQNWPEVRKELLRGLFEKTLAHFNDLLSKHLASSFDCLGMLLMLRVIEHSRLVVQRRGLRIPELAEFFGEQEELIWGRFAEVIDLQISSLFTFKPGPPFDTRPHFITRQYAEFCASVLSIGAKDQDNRLGSSMQRLRDQVVDVLQRIAAKLDTPMARAVFLINNYDVVVSVLREHERKGASRGNDFAHFTRALETQKAGFVEQELTMHFPAIVGFAQQKIEQQRAGRPSSADAPSEDVAVDVLIRSFNATWKSDLRKISADILEFFPNFGLGSEVLRQCLGQFVVFYTHLEDAVRRVQRTRDMSAAGGISKTFIPLATVTYEIRKMQP